VTAPPQPATVAMTYPSPATPAPQPRSRRRWIAGAAAILVLLLVLGVCAVVTQATTLTVNPSTAGRGETVRVTATHVPANQAGELQLFSIVHTFPFQANSKGEVTLDMTVPRDVNLGNHVLKICWSNTCPQQTTLRVVAGVGEVLPTPVGNQTPGVAPSPSGSHSPTPTATSGSTSRPTSTPTSAPTSTPTSRPTSTPTSQPSSPPPTPTSYITVSPTKVKPGGSVTVAGYYFGVARPITLTFTDVVSTTSANAAITSSSGYFTTVISIPATALLGTATIKACDNVGHCASQPIQVTTLLG